MADPFDEFLSGVSFLPPDPSTDPNVSQEEISADQSFKNQQEKFGKNSWDKQPQVAALLRSPPGGMSAAADRVNANTDNYGVKAVIGEDGRVTLTNVGVTPKTPVYPTANGGQGPGQGAIAPNTPLSVNSLFNKLKETTDVDTARGILSSLREASAIEQTKFETQAMQFAANKIGIPKLEADLNAAILADQQDPKYMPGMGDSPITNRIRTNLEQARGLADAEAKRYLAQNSSYAVLGATLKNADNEVARLTKIGDRKDALQDTIAMQAAARSQAKEDALTEQARGLDGIQRQRLLMLAPELGQVDPAKLDADMIRTINARKNDKAWVQTFQAPEEALPALALTGNQYAEQLVISKEQANAGIAPEITKARLDNLRVLTNNKDFLKKAFEEQYKGDPKAKQKVADAIGQFNEKGLTPEGKAQNQAIKMQLALDLAKKQTTVNFANSLDTWKIADPLFQQAVVEARKVTGKTQMLDVLNAYTKDAQGPDLIRRTQIFADLMTQEAQKHQNSIFGQPNYLALRSQIFKAQAKGPIRQWLESAGRTVTSWVPAASADAMQYTSPVGGTPDGGGLVIPDPLMNQDANTTFKNLGQ